LKPCRRCGIDVVNPGLCDDCADVTGEAKPVHTYPVPRSHRNYEVKSDRGTTGVTNRPELMEQVRSLNARGMSANEIALEVGVTTRTVTRWRKSLGVRSLLSPSDGFSHVRDQVAARAQLSRLMNEVNKKRNS